jgi:DNA-binding GntR family transcriptional regulator
VRDALIALEEEGLVNIYPQHITRVSAIDLELANETQVFRRAIECEIIEIICGKASDAFFTAAEKSIQNSERLLKENNMQAFMNEDHAFHFIFYKEAKIEGLYHLLRRKSGHIERLRRLSLPIESKAQNIIAAHKSFITALKNNDKQAAIVATRYHLQGTLQDAEALKLQYPHFFI